MVLSLHKEIKGDHLMHSFSSWIFLNWLCSKLSIFFFSDGISINEIDDVSGFVGRGLCCLASKVNFSVTEYCILSVRKGLVDK